MLHYSSRPRHQQEWNVASTLSVLSSFVYGVQLFITVHGNLLLLVSSGDWCAFLTQSKWSSSSQVEIFSLTSGHQRWFSTSLCYYSLIFFSVWSAILLPQVKKTLCWNSSRLLLILSQKYSWNFEAQTLLFFSYLCLAPEMLDRQMLFPQSCKWAVQWFKL